MPKKNDAHTLTKVVFYIFLGLIVSGNGTEGGSGCGCADDVTAPSVHNISLSTESLNFGETSVGTFSIQPLTITNPNEYAVMIQSLTVTNEGFQIGEYYIDGRLTEIDLPLTIEGNAEKTIYIGFYPQKPEEYSGSLVIESIDVSQQEPDVQTDTVSLRGVGVL